ncbi:hypothetical protein B9479_001106 [Cryptococcus floricola]|uniref:Uncharacterized protein n=1 Tax=Cryptococcus floricola TaxID=2591691 RepID=A0A5D3B7U2_9TREE|nr:hypothetical protein B9479_001106 [Cryptococcus floricola]
MSAPRRTESASASDEPAASQTYPPPPGSSSPHPSSSRSPSSHQPSKRQPAPPQSTRDHLTRPASVDTSTSINPPRDPSSQHEQQPQSPHQRQQQLRLLLVLGRRITRRVDGGARVHRYSRCKVKPDGHRYGITYSGSGLLLLTDHGN